MNEGIYAPEVLQGTAEKYRCIFLLCERIWNAVRPILCDDSPEGYLPDELDEMDGLDTRSLLSYSFRAIDESRYGHGHGRGHVCAPDIG